MSDAGLSDSYAPLVFELAMISGSNVISIPAHDYLQAIEIEIVSGGVSEAGGWKGAVTLFDEHGGYLEDLLMAAGQTRGMLVRWGWDRNVVNRYPTFEGGVSEYESDFSMEGLTLRVDHVPRPLLKAIQAQPAMSFAEGQKASDIFKEIAEAAEWVTVDEEGRSTVEETDGVLDQPLSYDNESHMRFVRDVLRPRAINADKDGYFFYFDEDNVAHFHSGGYLGWFDPRPTLAAKYVFARDAMGQVISFAPKMGALFQSVREGGNVIASAIDSIAGSRIEQTASRVSGTPGGRNISFQDATFIDDLGDAPMQRLSLPARDEAELNRMMAARHSRYKQTEYTAELEVVGTHAVRVMDAIQVDYITQTGEMHYLSGVFIVHKIVHSVGRGEWRTTFELMRPGIGANVPGAVRRDVDRESDVKEDEETETTTGGRRSKSGKAHIRKRQHRMKNT